MYLVYKRQCGMQNHPVIFCWEDKPASTGPVNSCSRVEEEDPKEGVRGWREQGEEIGGAGDDNVMDMEDRRQPREESEAAMDAKVMDMERPPPRAALYRQVTALDHYWAGLREARKRPGHYVQFNTT